jgi:hypothetical protein
VAEDRLRLTLRLSRRDLVSFLKEGTPITGSRQRLRLQDGLVVVQVLVGLVLTTCAILFLGAFEHFRAMARPRFGYNRIHRLLRREGWRRTRSECVGCIVSKGFSCGCAFGGASDALPRGLVAIPTDRSQRWSPDFVHDQLIDGRPFRVLTVVDQWSGESPMTECDLHSPGGASLPSWSRCNRSPASLTVDHDTEFRAG